MSDEQCDIRDAIKRRRRSLGLTQEDVSAAIGMSRVSYHRIERGIRRIHLHELALLCKAFDCHISELIQDAALAAGYMSFARNLLGQCEPQPRA